MNKNLGCKPIISISVVNPDTVRSGTFCSIRNNHFKFGSGKDPNIRLALKQNLFIIKYIFHVEMVQVQFTESDYLPT